MKNRHRIVCISVIPLLISFLSYPAVAQDTSEVSSSVVDTTDEQDRQRCEAIKASGASAPPGVPGFTCEEIVRLSKPRKTAEVIVLPAKPAEEIKE